MNSQFNTDIMQEIPAMGLTAQETPFITFDGDEIIPPYYPVDGQDPACFTHEGKKIPYKSTNYYKQQCIQNDAANEIQHHQVVEIIEKPLLKRDTCMNEIQPAVRLDELSETSFIACSSYLNEEETKSDCDIQLQLQNQMLDELLGFSTCDDLEQLSQGTTFAFNQDMLNYPRFFGGQNSDNIWNPSESNADVIDDDDTSANNDVYIPEDAVYIDEDAVYIDTDLAYDLARLKSMDTCTHNNEWLNTRETNRPEIVGPFDYSWVEILKESADFDLYKHLLSLPELSQPMIECQPNTFTDFSHLSDCFESNQSLNADDSTYLHELKDDVVLPQVSEDGPIASPKPMTRVIGEERRRRGWEYLPDDFIIEPILRDY